MGPLDYSSPFANLPTAGASLMQGVQAGAAIQQAQVERQQKQLAAQQAQQQRDDLAALSQNPTPDAIASLMIKYPALSEQLKRGSDVLTSAQQQGRLDSASQVYAALQSGAPDIAAQLLKDQAAAARNSGNERDAQAADTFAKMVTEHPEFAKTTIGLRLAAAVGPEKFAETFAKMGSEQRAQELQGDAVRKGKADADAAGSKAQTAATEAKYADQAALLELDKKGWDIKALRADMEYKRESNRIAAMNAAANRESNSLKKQELQLKIQDTIRERDDKLREKVSKVESATTSIDNMINTVERVLANPSLSNVVGSIEGRLPSVLSDEGADAIALIDTLGSQAFLSQVPSIQGMGALSNAEGEKLQSALQNLKRTQSETQFRANLKEVQRLVLKSRESISKRYGVPVGAPDVPAAPQSSTPGVPAGWTVTVKGD